ncbi:af4 fmr2 family member 1 isoform x2 [Limosa lapponica baueri]|uniref:Af4 fmr2 family member 1 isoform x2 n=1 Tax=Limosa lapponica baueri TaxID=1758121 RepID=A0A2I0U6S1_LIMLA|nr:af4 fmr2 family member 1 isoform x2 [Limosa lapponica baueri]
MVIGECVLQEHMLPREARSDLVVWEGFYTEDVFHKKHYRFAHVLSNPDKFLSDIVYAKSGELLQGAWDDVVNADAPGCVIGMAVLMGNLYNEDRNLLRIREKERRNQEALQEKDKFLEKTPLFAEPYKTNKEDELSSRIQNMLGNYEEVKELISNKSHQNLIGIPKNVAPLIPQGKPDRPYCLEKSSHTLPSSFHRTTHHPPTGPTVVAPPPPSHSIHYQKAQSRTEQPSGLHTKSHGLSNGWSQGQECNRGGQESYTGFHKRNDRRAGGEGHANELEASLLALSPLLSSLSSPVTPLSPLHSSQHINSRSQNSSKSYRATYSQTKSSQDLVTGSQEKKSRESSAIKLTSTTQPLSHAFPPSLPSKTSAMQQKPTAYVRPMDGQDQAPVESPELKPLMEEYHGEPYEKISDLKANAKAKLSKLEIPSEPIEVSASEK